MFPRDERSFPGRNQTISPAYGEQEVDLGPVAIAGQHPQHPDFKVMVHCLLRMESLSKLQCLGSLIKSSRDVF